MPDTDSVPDTDEGRFARARRALRGHYGFTDFRGPQAAVVRAVLAGRDVLAILPTGAGKSICFQIPAVLSPGLTIVVTPLVSLMEDQVARAVRRRIPAAAVHANRKAVPGGALQGRVARGKLKLLYVAPERLPTDSLYRLLDGTRVSRIAVDEAHCVSEWGHDFRPAYRKIAAFRRRVGNPPCIALTATATPPTRVDVAANLELCQPATLVWPVDRPNLYWEVRRGGQSAEAARGLVRAVRDTPGAAILYVPSRRGAVRMADALRRSGVVSAAYHAGMDAAARQATQDAFVNGRLRAVCATTAFGMGIDHPSVRLVGHFGRPGSLEAYVQEAGRAGRDGAPARCLLAVWGGDEAIQRAMHARTAPPERSARAVWMSLPPGVPVNRERLKRLQGTGLEEALDVISIFERHDAVRRAPGATHSRSRTTSSDEAWVRGPEPLWGRLATALAWSRSRARDRLAAMREYVESPRCRRRAIARYFEDAMPTCGGCDRCDRTAG